MSRDDDVIIIRNKLNEPAAPSVSSNLKVWHVLAGVAVIAFALGALIF